MKNLKTVMLRAEAIEEFETTELPGILAMEERNGKRDISRRRMAWNNFTDMLCKCNRISDWQDENWSQPDWCEQMKKIDIVEFSIGYAMLNVALLLYLKIF